MNKTFSTSARREWQDFGKGQIESLGYIKDLEPNWKFISETIDRFSKQYYT